MELKNGLFILAIALGINVVSGTAHAVVFPDQEVMNGATEDENADAVSSFGETKRKVVQKTTRNLTPISESSFARENGRAPASSPNRSPAGAGVVQVQPHSTSKAAIAREAKQSKAFQEVAVIANDLGFFPSTLFLTEGVPVRLFITGASQKSQCFMLDQFGVRRQIRNQKIEEVTFTPDQSGTFSFHCPMNGAKGTVVVKEMEIASERVPASTDEAGSSASIPAAAAPVEAKREKHKSMIRDEDFTPEFRN